MLFFVLIAGVLVGQDEKPRRYASGKQHPATPKVYLLAAPSRCCYSLFGSDVFSPPATDTSITLLLFAPPWLYRCYGLGWSDVELRGQVELRPAPGQKRPRDDDEVEIIEAGRARRDRQSKD